MLILISRHWMELGLKQCKRKTNKNKFQAKNYHFIQCCALANVISFQYEFKCKLICDWMKSMVTKKKEKQFFLVIQTKITIHGKQK